MPRLEQWANFPKKVANHEENFHNILICEHDNRNGMLPGIFNRRAVSFFQIGPCFLDSQGACTVRLIRGELDQAQLDHSWPIADAFSNHQPGRSSDERQYLRALPLR